MGFGRRSKDLSFTASSELEPLFSIPPSLPPSPFSSLCCINAAAAQSQSFPQGSVHPLPGRCSYVSVLNRDVSANGSWQGPSPGRTICWSGARTGGEGRDGNRRWREVWVRAHCREEPAALGGGGSSCFTTAPSVFAKRATRVLLLLVPCHFTFSSLVLASLCLL